MVNINSLKLRYLKVEDNEKEQVYYIYTDPKVFRNILALIYILIFSYIDVTIVIDSWVKGNATFSDVLLVNGIFLGISLFFLFLSPFMLKLMSKIQGNGRIISVDKVNKVVSIVLENLTLKLADIKGVSLKEDKWLFGIRYFLVFKLSDMEKSILPPLNFNDATMLKEGLGKFVVAG